MIFSGIQKLQHLPNIYILEKTKIIKKMFSRKLLEDKDTFSLLIQLTDIAASAHERGDFRRRDAALDEIREIRKQIAGQIVESAGDCNE